MLYQSEAGEFSLALAGDAMVTRKLSVFKEPSYLKLVELLRNADAACCNLEMPIHDYQHAANFTSGPHMSSLPSAAEELRWMGIKFASTANNHIFDYGAGGLLSTQKKLDEAGILYAGTGRNLSEARSPIYLDTPNGRIAFLAAVSYYPDWGKAGEQRPDFQGRPGLSFLRFQTTHTVDAQAFNELKRISSKLGLQLIKTHRSTFSSYKYEKGEEELNFLPSLKFREHGPEDVRFVLGKDFHTTTKLHEPDAEDVLKWVRDARRQADLVVFSLHSHEGAFPVEGDTREVIAQGLRDVPADYIRDFSRACIEAGADVVLGHGSHVLRGIEVYKDKPIFYSLGELVFEIETIQRQPADAYGRFGLGHGATPADFYDAWTGGGTRMYVPDPNYWRSVVALCRFSGGRFTHMELHPLDLGFGTPRGQRGRPLLAQEPLASEVINHLEEISQAFGTKIHREGEAWIIRP